MEPIRTARDLGATIRGRRVDLRLTQADVADGARVGRQWLSEVEGGKDTAEIGRILRVLEVLGLDVVPQARSTGGSPGRVEAIEVVDLDDLLDGYSRR